VRHSWERSSERGLDELRQKNRSLVGVKGLGLMIGMEFDTKQSRDAKLMQALKKGLLLLLAGQKAMRVIPPLVITEEEVQEGLQLMGKVFLSC
jgi:4-aminobutyrate aminotransferase